jgi:thiosulfate dehydrogenase
MGKIALFAIIILAIATGLWMTSTLHLDEEHVLIGGGTLGSRYYIFHDKEDKENKLVHFDLVDPEVAPEDMLNKILYGYHIMLETKKHAPEYSGNSLDCNNCHFNAGNTLGGKNRGISLVGVTEVYPRFSKRDNKEISLADRIGNCFKRSMNGKPPPANSLEMEALLAYLAWISHEVTDAPMLPWLGLDNTPSKHVPNPKKGRRLYRKHCSICHGRNGEGNQGLDGSGAESIPPLWGPHSYNDGAGMNTLPMLSSFIWQNMPYGQPILTPEEALDIAQYLINRPRPHFKP